LLKNTAILGKIASFAIAIHLLGAELSGSYTQKILKIP